MSYNKTYHYEEKFNISWQSIISSTDQLSLWSWFFNHNVELGKYVCNPMRADRHPNCWLSWGLTKTKFIVLNDFADRRFHGMTVFDAISYAYGLKFNETLEKIYEEYILPGDIELKDVPTTKYSPKDNFSFILNYIPWTLDGREIYTENDKIFWSQYEITREQLEQDSVKSNRSVLFNSRKQPNSFTSLSVNPSYTYLFGDHKKCYQPYHKTHKWLSTCTEEDIGGWDTVTDNDLIITKSYKDWRVLKNSGYNTIWLQNEGCKIPFDKLIALQAITTKFILFDNDTPGKQASQTLADYANQFDDSYIPVWFDEHMPKDSADVVKHYSSRVLEQELANIGIQ